MAWVFPRRENDAYQIRQGLIIDRDGGYLQNNVTIQSVLQSNTVTGPDRELPVLPNRDLRVLVDLDY